MKKFIVTGESESGDHLGPIIFKKKPTNEQLKSVIRATGEEVPHLEDGEEGPGDFGSYVFLEVTEVEEK